ncbi:B-box type zinc finger protein ncl-1 [Elysia marginata]|uniref:B-box type zinc finger protein ncl-1 n=1 Tax=Elysia marginata TaxID=1093978 RepID=A0AAV4J8N8_9GAST|nr:B-box type zinc finger protein ncl-1 [Elysia marginata]
MDIKAKECQDHPSDGHRKSDPGQNQGEPPEEVMSKLQHQLERVQRDIQIQQRQAQRQPSSRFRSDSRRGSDPDRQGRMSSSGFKPYPRQGGVRPRAIDPATCAPWVHPGDFSVRGQRASWAGHRLPRMQEPRASWWHGDRPQTNFGHVGRTLTGTRPGLNVWHRPLMRHFSPALSVARADKTASNPYSAQARPQWQIKEGDVIPQQQDVNPCPIVSKIIKVDNQYGSNSSKAIPGGTTSKKDKEFCPSDHSILGKSYLGHSPQKPDSPRDEKNADDANSSPQRRKDRSSSGPKTPPGLKQDVSFDFSSIRGGNYGWHSLFLADLSLKMAQDTEELSDPFEDPSIQCLQKSGLTEFESETIKEKNNWQDTTAASLMGVSDVTQQGGKMEPIKSIQPVKSVERLGTIGGGKATDSYPCELDKNFKTLFGPLKILRRDANNNLPCHPNKNLQHTTKETVSLLQEDVSLKSAQTTRPQTEIMKMSNASLPIAFVSPFQYEADQQKSNVKTSGRVSRNALVGVDLRDTTCPKCHDNLRWPHLLVCCHRLCFPCLVAIYDRESMRIQCPYCRSITRTDESLSNLVLDLHRCREMCALQISPFVCTLCKENKHADTVCKTCPGFLCRDCTIKHSDEIEFSTHKMELVQTVGYNLDGELHPMCSKHPGVLLSQFCVDCSFMVCSICLQHSHVGHETCDLTSGKQIAEDRFREMNSGLMDMVELCQKKLQNFNLSKQKVEVSMKVVRNNIHKACNQMISYIEMFEKVSKSLADKVHTAGVKHLNRLEKEANKYDQERATFEEFCTRYIDDSRPEELTAVLPLVHQQLGRLKDFYSQSTLLSPDLSIDLKFDPVYPEFNEAISRMFAELRFEHNVTLESLLNSSIGERAVLESVQPQPYDRPFQMDSESASSSSLSSREAPSSSSGEATSGDEMLKHFIRQTTACKYVFGKYGRGDYEFAEPSGLCYLHNNSLAVCDAKNHRVIVYDETCKFSKTIGQPCNLPPLPATLNSAENEPCFTRTPGALFFPFRLAQCPVTHNLVIVERPPSTDIQVFRFDGSFIRCFGNDYLKYPRGITVNESGQILVVESRTMKVFIFSMEGVKLQAFYLSMHLEFPNDIATKGDKIFISDNRTHCVHVYDYNLEWQRQIGHESLTYFPIGVAVNHLGQVVVADNHNTFNITVFNQDGSFIHGFKSQSKHANCYSVALHPRRTELAVTTKECKVVLFDYNMDDSLGTGTYTALSLDRQ